MQPAMMTSPYVYDYYDVWKWRKRLTLGLIVPENTNYMKKVSSKSCLFRIKFFTKESLGTHVYLTPPQGAARGLERLAYLKYYDVWKCENKLTLGLTPAENVDYIKKSFK